MWSNDKDFGFCWVRLETTEELMAEEWQDLAWLLKEVQIANKYQEAKKGSQETSDSSKPEDQWGNAPVSQETKEGIL